MSTHEYLWVDMAEIRTKIDIDPLDLFIIAGLYQDKPLIHLDKNSLFSDFNQFKK
jgi:hypothetical protein